MRRDVAEGGNKESRTRQHHISFILLCLCRNRWLLCPKLAKNKKHNKVARNDILEDSFILCVYLLCTSYTNVFGIKAEHLVCEIKKGESEVTSPLCKTCKQIFIFFLTGKFEKKKSRWKDSQECAMLMINTENN